jgi:alcohol dehydrogenase (cytochrome c)
MPVEYDPNLSVQTYVPESRALRADFGTTVTACPTWHGGTAHQPPAYNPVKYIAYTVGTEGCFNSDLTKSALADPMPVAGQGTITGRVGTISDLYYGAITAVDVRTADIIAKVNVDTEIRSGMLATAGGLVFTCLTNGDIVALNDETLEQLWKFNVGTPLKAPPMTFAVDGRQYVAFQTSGLHVHPKRFTDNMHSEYLFVFALN